MGRVILARRRGLSLRAIALQEQVSERQIRFDLKRANADGHSVAPTLSEVVGLDGKRRGARKPAATTPNGGRPPKAESERPVINAVTKRECIVCGGNGGAHDPQCSLYIREKTLVA
jgi:hypothetical protein